MIEFLETDLKVQQQKVLIRNKPDEKPERSDEKKSKEKQFANSSHYKDDDDTMKCFFCECEDHVATNGPLSRCKTSLPSIKWENVNTILYAVMNPIVFTLCGNLYWYVMNIVTLKQTRNYSKNTKINVLSKEYRVTLILT